MTKPICKFENCDREVYAREICHRHYNMERRNGRLVSTETGVMPQCTIHGCLRFRASQGLCTTHLTRLKKYGDPMHTERFRAEGNTPTERFWALVDKVSDPKGCWLWTGFTEKGYGKTGFNGDRWFTHRLAWFLIKGTEPVGILRHYVCDNPPCCNPDHMKEGTSDDNVQDMVGKGRNVRGEKVHTAKLTEGQVLEARKLMFEGVSTGSVAKLMGVCRSTMTKIKNGDNWKHI